MADMSYHPYEAITELDPLPTNRWLRDEQPLYYNEDYDFYAVSRYDDCEHGLVDAKRYISGRGGMLELIKADIEMPPGTLIFEDPPAHTAHRSLLSRVFTPRTCPRSSRRSASSAHAASTRSSGADEFDLIGDFGAQMPMRVIGMLFGIPEADQAASVRVSTRHCARRRASRCRSAEEPTFGGEMFGEYIDWRVDHPSDDLMTELLHAEFEDETGTTRTLTRDEALLYTTVVAGAGNETTTRLIGWAGKLLAEHPDQRRELVGDPALIPNAVEELVRYEPPGPQSVATCPPTSSSTVRPCPRAAPCCSWSAPRTATTAGSTTPTGSTSTARSASTSPSVTASTSASAPRSPRLEGRIAVEELLARFPEWEVDLERASIAPTSTVRGFETLPVLCLDRHAGHGATSLRQHAAPRTRGAKRGAHRRRRRRAPA